MAVLAAGRSEHSVVSPRKMLPLTDPDRSRRNISATAHFASPTPLASLLERIGFHALLVIILLSAIPYGTADPFFKSLLIVCVCVVAVIRLLQHLAGTPVRFAEPAMLLPLAGILLLAVFQTVPLPLLGGKPISWDPYETKIFILSFACLLIATELLFFYTTTRRRLWFVSLLVLLTGAASAGFGLFCSLAEIEPTSLIATFFFREFSTDTQGYAQFINRNHFAVLMEMSLGLALGLLLKGRWSRGQKFIGWALVALFMLATISANSRGGLISLAALGVFAAFIHIMTMKPKSGAHDKLPIHKTWHKAVLAVVVSCIVFGMFVFTVAFVGGDDVVHRIEKLPNEVEARGEGTLNRRAIWQVTWRMIKAEPLTGIGFGAYETAFPAFDRSGGKWIAQQAHNDYLEILANGGAVAFVLFAVAAVIVTRRALKNFDADDPLVRSGCFGALIGIFGVMVHSIADFGLHIMINALIFAALIVIATARITDATRKP